MVGPGAVLILGVAVALGGSGCRREGRSPGGDRRRAAGITLTSPGAAPRRLLRYRFAAGERLRYRMKSRRKISRLPAPLEPVRLVLSVQTERARGSRALVRWRVERVISGSPRLLGLSLWMETSDRGEITRVSRLPPAPGGAPASGAKGAPLGQSLRQLLLAWPAEPVGVGATWTQVRDLILVPSMGGGIRARIEARYRVERVKGCGQGRCVSLSVRSDLRLSQRAGRVKILGTGSGVGRVLFDLSRGRLLESHTRATIRMSTSLAPGKVVQRLVLEQSMELTR